MARQYLRLGSQEVTVTDEQKRQLEESRWNPAKLKQVKFVIFTEAGIKPETVHELMAQPVATS